MKSKSAWIFAAFTAAVFIGVLGDYSFARLTGTNPTGSSADAWCVGKKSSESCVDSSGNVIPTTNNTQKSGTSSLQWTDVETTNINSGAGAVTLGGAATITGLSTLTSGYVTVPVAAQTLGSGFTINADACGGVKLVQAASAVTSATLNVFQSTATAPSYCEMEIVNISSQPITFVNTANWLQKGGGSFTLIDSSDVIKALALPTTGWIQVGGTRP